MGKETIEAAKKIITRKQSSSATGEDYEFLIQKIKSIELKLASMGNFETKLDKILKKLS